MQKVDLEPTEKLGQTSADKIIGKAGQKLANLASSIDGLKSVADKLPQSAEEVSYLRELETAVSLSQIQLLRLQLSLRMKEGRATQREVKKLYPDIGDEIWQAYSKDKRKGIFLVGPQYSTKTEFHFFSDLYDISINVAEAAYAVEDNLAN